MTCDPIRVAPSAVRFGEKIRTYRKYKACAVDRVPIGTPDSARNRDRGDIGGNGPVSDTELA